MRINLLLQQSELCLSHLPFILTNLHHHHRKMLRHIIDTDSKRRQLPVAFFIRPNREITLCNLMSDLTKSQNRSRNTPRNSGFDNRHKHSQSNKQEDHTDNKGNRLLIQGSPHHLHTLCLIVDIVLNVILYQLCQNIDVVVQHLDVLIVMPTLLQIEAYVIHTFPQGINIAKKILEPAAGSRIRCNGFQFPEIALKLIQKRIRILQRIRYRNLIKGRPAHHDLIQVFIHFFFKRQIIAVRHCHIADHAVIGIAVRQKCIQKIRSHTQKRQHSCRHQKRQLMIDRVFFFFLSRCHPVSPQINPPLRRSHSHRVRVTDDSSVVVTTMDADNVPSCPMFFAII